MGFHYFINFGIALYIFQLIYLHTHLPACFWLKWLDGKLNCDLEWSNVATYCDVNFLFTGPFTRTYGGYSGSMDDVLIVLGGRAINHMQVDKQIGAEMAAMVLQFSLPPRMFSVCVTDCIEDLTANTNAVPEIFSTGYDKALRRLELLGQASPQDYQSVLQTLMYINSVQRLYPDYLVLTVSDGIHNITESIPVVTTNSRRRKSTTSNKHLYMLRHLNSKDVFDTSSVKPHDETPEKSKEVKHVLLVIPILIVFVAAMIILFTFGKWKKRDTKQDPCNSP